MADAPVGHRLGRWLPDAVRRDLFEPALQDLYIRALVQPERSQNAARRVLLRGRFATAVAALYLTCWWTALVSRSLDVVPSDLPRTSIKERGFLMWNDMRQAIRLLFRERAFAAAAILTLALGIGANVAVFAVVEAVLLRPLPYESAERLVILNHRDERTGLTKDFIALGDLVDIASRHPTLEHVTAFGTGRTTLYGIGEPLIATSLIAEPQLFDAFGLAVLHGRRLAAADARQGAAPVAVMGHEFWRTHFSADPRVIGRRIRIGQVEREIVGIAPPRFKFPAGRATDLIMPFAVPAQAATLRNNAWMLAVGRLKPGASVSQANVALTTIAEQLEREYPRTNPGTRYFATSMRDSLIGDTKKPLTLLLAAVAVVLLIACVNVGNLLLARALGRRHEMALRVALGAGRGRLVGQLLAESLVLAVVAGAAGIALAYVGTPALVALIPQAVRAPGLADVGLNGRVLAYTFGVSVAAALAFGLMSAIAAGRPIASSLTAPARAGLSRRVRRAASSLVVVEIALAVVLLLGAGLILRSFVRLMSVDPGFRVDHVLTIDIALPAAGYQTVESRQAFYQRAFAGVRALPDVQAVGAAAVTPLTGNNWTIPFERTDRPAAAGERPPDVGWQQASGGYFRALQIPLRSGRLFDERDGPTGATTVIVSEAIEKRFFGGESAVGRHVRIGQNQAEIVGVVGDIRRAALTDEPRADMYLPFERQPPTAVTLFVQTATDPARVVVAARQAMRAIEPNLAISEISSMQETAAESVASTRLALWLLGVFAVVAVTLAAVGIYGVMSYVVRQRTREIGTRLALGARPNDILWLVVRGGGVLGLIGVALGLGAGLFAARSLTSILYGIPTWDPRTVTTAAVALVATALVASYLPARRAARTDPARTLTGS